MCLSVCQYVMFLLRGRQSAGPATIVTQQWATLFPIVGKHFPQEMLRTTLIQECPKAQ
jgi:hypothetical protein